MTCLNFSFDILSLISASKWSITLPLAGLPRFIPNLSPSRNVLIGYFNNQCNLIVSYCPRPDCKIDLKLHDMLNKSDDRFFCLCNVIFINLRTGGG